MRRGDKAKMGIGRGRARRQDARAVQRCCLALLSSLLFAGCAEQITKHGMLFHENDLQQIQPGMGQEQVRMALGSPTTTTTSGTGNVFYYISSTEKQTAFFSPHETDRQVVAVYFTPTGTVDRVANYGLQDGKVFDFVSRTTPAPGAHDEGLLKQLFRNLGQKQIFGDG
jgi:outer membrane protein assembly factor BamE (lipoprotein component of BamABCDE complex)